MTWDFTFTVFTPTYNRAHTLPRVYESLCAQTFRDFEWLVVDDGSTDGTENLVRRWQAEADFPIRYIWKENGGKHTAHNRALAESRGRFLLTLDSDDECLPTALERFLHHWNTIPEGSRTGFSGVTGLCVDVNGVVVGDTFPTDPLDTSPLDVIFKYKVHGEKWGFMRTDVLRQFPFPETQGVKALVPEGTIWTRIGRSYKTRFVNEVVRIYHAGHESLSTSVRRPVVDRRRALTGTIQHGQALNEYIDYFHFARQWFLLSAVHYSRFSFHLGVYPANQWRSLTNPGARLLWLAGLPLAIFLFLRDNWRKRRTSLMA